MFPSLILKKSGTKNRKKIPTAIFRGSSTGCGASLKTNPRIHLAYLSKKWDSDNRYNKNNKIDKYSFLDAGITNWVSNRIRKENIHSFYSLVKKNMNNRKVIFVFEKKKIFFIRTFY